ncbi:MAG: hypothetical protein EZS28_021991 [Streblomastix strix]|uniref:Uncharacterized protein n=1 Tax=Streblomastix strix TaxID=222440 RepID=A0A5J4VJN8_9EUKA|nr:MAG: hypothetical protein EZS28_021991 [Streblomastix strix]
MSDFYRWGRSVGAATPKLPLQWSRSIPPQQPMLADIEEHPHTSKVRIPRITAVPELRVVAAASNNQALTIDAL